MKIVNTTRKERAVEAYKKFSPKTPQEVKAYKRGYEAAEWDYEQAMMRRRESSEW